MQLLSLSLQTNQQQDYCREGYEGPLCSVCADENKFFDPLDGECYVCPSFWRLFILPACILLVGLILYGLHVAKKHFPSFDRKIQKLSLIISALSLQAKFKIFISFFQIIVVLEPIYGVKVHEDFTNFFDFFVRV